MHRMVSFWVLIGILALVGVVFYRVMAGFLLPLFLAALLAVIFQPLHLWALRRTGQRAYVAASLTTVLVTLIVFVPVVWGASVAIREAFAVANHFEPQQVANEVARLRVQLRLDLPLHEDAADVVIRYRQLDRALAELEAVEPTDEPPPPDGPLDRFSQQLQELQRRQGDLLQMMPPEDRPDPTGEAALLRRRFDDWNASLRRLQTELGREDRATLRQTLASSQESFDALYNQLPGGISRVWARDMLEPSSARWKELQGRLVAELQAVAVPAANATLGFVLKLIFGCVIMFVSLFFFLADGHRMSESIMRLVPLDIRHQHELLDDFTCTSRAVVLATLISAFVQGVLAGLGFWVAEVESVMLLTILTMVFAMIPFVGALAVWAPVSLWLLLAEGRTWPAVLLALYGGVIVSQSDNVVKPLILKGQSNLHPLLALLSILGGVTSIGPAGILIGPLVVVFLQTLLRILHRELTGFENKAPGAGASSPAVGETTQTA